jgi:glycosyltransferase involved in cell wall biosynthesis
MRILQLIDTLKIGGAERMAVNISNVLAINGHEVVLCATREGGSLVQFIHGAVKYKQLHKRHAIDIFSFISLSKLIRLHKIELIHAHSSSIYWAVGAKLLNPGVKVVWHDHAGNSESLTNNDRKGIQSISKRIDSIIAVNEKLQNWSVVNTKVDNNNILFINNFPLLSIAPNTPRDDPDRIKIICLANIRSQKDHSTLIEAIHILCSQHSIPNIEVLLVGAFYDDDYCRNIKTLIHQYNLASVIKLVGPVEDTASLLSSVDIGVLSSESEGLPVSLLEYGLAGLPVVCTDVGQCKAVLGNGTLGWVVPPKNAIQLADAILDVLKDRTRSYTIGQGLKKHITTRYSAEAFMAAYTKLIHAL